MRRTCNISTNCCVRSDICSFAYETHSILAYNCRTMQRQIPELTVPAVAPLLRDLLMFAEAPFHSWFLGQSSFGLFSLCLLQLRPPSGPLRVLPLLHPFHLRCAHASLKVALFLLCSYPWLPLTASRHWRRSPLPLTRAVAVDGEGFFDPPRVVGLAWAGSISSISSPSNSITSALSSSANSPRCCGFRLRTTLPFFAGG